MNIYRAERREQKEARRLKEEQRYELKRASALQERSMFPLPVRLDIVLWYSTVKKMKY